MTDQNVKKITKVTWTVDAEDIIRVAENNDRSDIAGNKEKVQEILETVDAEFRGGNNRALSDDFIADLVVDMPEEVDLQELDDTLKKLRKAIEDKCATCGELGVNCIDNGCSHLQSVIAITEQINES